MVGEGGLDVVEPEESDGFNGVIVVVINGDENRGGMLTEVTTGCDSCGVMSKRWISAEFCA